MMQQQAVNYTPILLHHPWHSCKVTQVLKCNFKQVKDASHALLHLWCWRQKYIKYCFLVNVEFCTKTWDAHLKWQRINRKQSEVSRGISYTRSESTAKFFCGVIKMLDSNVRVSFKCKVYFPGSKMEEAKEVPKYHFLKCGTSVSESRFLKTFRLKQPAGIQIFTTFWEKCLCLYLLIFH